MNEEHDKAWKDLAKRAHRGESHVISGGAADRWLRSMPDECMAEADLDAIVESIVSGRSLRATRGPEVSSTEDQGGVAAPKHVDEDVLQLNRNKGVEDKNAEELLDELRREALEDDGREDKDKGP